jgi:hypothetical protein
MYSSNNDVGKGNSLSLMASSSKEIHIDELREGEVCEEKEEEEEDIAAEDSINYVAAFPTFFVPTTFKAHNNPFRRKAIVVEKVEEKKEELHSNSEDENMDSYYKAITEEATKVNKTPREDMQSLYNKRHGNFVILITKNGQTSFDQIKSYITTVTPKIAKIYLDPQNEEYLVKSVIP